MPDFIGHEIVLGHLLPHVRGLPSVPQGGILYFFAPFRFAHHFEGIVHVTFERIHQVRVLLEFPLPVFHRFETFVGQTGRQSQLQHLDARSHFHDQPFQFHGIFRRRHTVFHHHAFPCEPLLVSRGADDLPQGFLHVVVVMFELPLTRHIDRIFIRLVVGHSAAVRADRYEIVPHFQQEVVETATQPSFVGLRVTSLHGTSVPQQYGVIK